MNKLGALLIIIGGVVFAYVILTAAQGAIVGIVSSANASITANTTNMPGAREGLLAMPWVVYFIPGVMGIVAVVMLLRAKK